MFWKVPNMLLCASTLLGVLSYCASAPQSYYSQYPYRRAAYTPYSNSFSNLFRPYSSSVARAYTPYNRRADSSSSYTAAAYNAALQQRRARAQALRSAYLYGSNSGSNSNDNAAGYSSRLPARADTVAASSNDSSTDLDNTTPIYNNRYQQYINATRGNLRVSKADAENAKFAGANNQEADDETTKTAALLQRKRLRGRRCFPFGRDAAAAAGSKDAANSEQGRFLFDLNVYNVYPNGYGGGGGLFSGGGGCGGGLGGGGGLLGGGLLSDPVAGPAYPQAPLNNFLQLFAPGILQNALAATARPLPFRPQLQSDAADAEVNDSDPEVDPGYAPPARPVPVRRPNRIYYDSPGAVPITPAQLVGGVATTVNGIIQQLTGNVQPVYPSYRRAPSYGK